MKLLVLLLEVSPEALEVRRFLTRALLRFAKWSVRLGWNRWCGGRRRRRLLLA